MEPVNTLTMLKVYIYPDGTNAEEPYSWKSDDYVVRHTACCEGCGHILELDYDSPFGHCDCGTQEWHY